MSARGLIDDKPSAGAIIPWIHQADEPSANRIGETAGLVEALGFTTGFIRSERVRKPSASHLLSEGLLERAADDLVQSDAGLLVLDTDLTPIQQRNLERRLNVKVIDRTGLILEIFGLRARTREGVLQVELARLLYERSRLVRTWTHLERQRGGRGFLAGPGETQLEADRRMLDDTLRRLRKSLTEVRRTRRLQRKGRKRAELPMVALVGYTNAGKSTLFNRLTGADVFVRDMPFATLDPTIRRVTLPAAGDIAVVDTVGFISDLPTHLVESFQATLEEAISADLLIHVRDRSNPDEQLQKGDVEQVLERLEEATGLTRPLVLEVWNKADQLEASHQARLAAEAAQDGAVLCSALTGAGCDAVLASIVERLNSGSVMLTISFDTNDGALRALLYRSCHVLAERPGDEPGQTEIELRCSQLILGRLQASYPEIFAD